MDSISVVIPTMNRINSLKNTINSFLSGEVVPNEIIIVDQSNDGNTSKEIINYINEYKNNSAFDIIYYYQKEASSTVARNNGLKLANNDIIIFSDDDVELNNDTIKNISLIMGNTQIAMVAGVNELENTAKSKLGYLLGFKSFKYRNIGHVASGLFGRFPKKIGEETNTMWAMGFFFVVRKSLINNWGIQWDEKLTSYAYAEDLDFSYSYYKKSIENGYKCVITDKVIVKHLNSQEYRTPSRKSTFMYVLNRSYLYHKHGFSYRYWIMFNVANYSMLVKRIITKKKPRDLYDAMKYLRKHKKEVFNGDFKYD